MTAPSEKQQQGYERAKAALSEAFRMGVNGEPLSGDALEAAEVCDKLQQQGWATNVFRSEYAKGDSK